jgi:hypothetical protein
LDKAIEDAEYNLNKIKDSGEDPADYEQALENAKTALNDFLKDNSYETKEKELKTQ